jgi:hypothetical protein
MAQGGYFELVPPGWRSSFLIEEEDRLVLMALALEDSPTEHHYLFQAIDKEVGILQSTLSIDSDTLYSLSSYETPNTLVEMPDGRYLGIGAMAPEVPSNIYAISYILDTQENTFELVDWDYLIEGENLQLKFIRRIGDGFLVGAERHMSGRTEISLLWLDENGEFVNRQDYPFLNGQYLRIHDMEVNEEGVFLLMQNSETIPGTIFTKQYSILMRINLDGEEQWRRDMGDNQEFYVIPGGMSIVGQDSIYVCYSYPYSYDEDWDYLFNWDNNVPIIDCFSSAGNVHWNHSFEGSIPFGRTSIHQLDSYEDEGILMSGWKDGGVFVTKLNNDLSIEWQHVHQYFENESEIIPNDEAELYHFVPSIYDDGYYGVGKYRSYPNELFPNGILLTFVLRLDEFGCVIENCQSSLEEQKLLQVSVYPNPTKVGYAVISLVEQADALRIFDLQGREVISYRIHDSSTTFTFSTSPLDPGLYVIRLDSEEQPVALAKLLVK